MDLGPEKIVLILLVAVLLFGAKRLPEIGRGLGKGLREFKSAIKGLSDDEQESAPSPSASDKPPADTKPHS